ncbi:(d)CMP kinase [Paenibacillus sp. y28]|uniref:(d)CMP kinase n=1 Tax=Paenibacillus sp. y28 TaxID=3129110 RepID=UPI003018AD57
MNIAIDGPAGAGKSTVARLVAKRLGYVYVDTGAMYRAVTWKVLQQGLQVEQTQLVIRTAEQMTIELQPGELAQQVLADGQDVSEEIRHPEVSNRVSYVAQIPEVRKLLVDKQQQMARQKGVVMDGRDIGTHVLPDAEVKVFLTASVQERASRRYQELQSKNQTVSLSQLEHDIALRDKMDEERETSPLRQAEDAVVVDSTKLSIEQVVDKIVSLTAVYAGKEYE